VLVNVSLNSTDDGAVQVRIGPPQSSNVSIQTYSSTSAARQVLIAIGIDPQEVDTVLKLLSQVSQGKQLQFSSRFVEQKVLWENGFRL